MSDIIPLIKDSIGIWQFGLALLLAVVLKKRKMLHIIAYAALIGFVSRIIDLFANPFSRAFIKASYSKISASNTIETILLSCVASAIVTAFFAGVFGVIVKRRQSRNAISKE